jgi:hypothetical protein
MVSAKPLAFMHSGCCDTLADARHRPDAGPSERQNAAVSMTDADLDQSRGSRAKESVPTILRSCCPINESGRRGGPPWGLIVVQQGDYATLRCAFLIRTSMAAAEPADTMNRKGVFRMLARNRIVIGLPSRKRTQGEQTRTAS